MSQPVIALTVPGIAIPKGSMRPVWIHGRTVLIRDNPKTKRWERAVAVAARLARGARLPFEGAVTVRMHCYLPRPKSLPRRVQAHLKKPDTDKLARAVLDGLCGVLYLDDAQVTVLAVEKSYAIGEARTTIWVLADSPQDAHDAD